ncbi:gamma-glutamylcyclotransferase family protein [Anaerocolumna sp. MB42-C2]|nr:gamma-glutamylcyclotransferase family protein [Anaerocolumna sp. MB42-C2]WMJ90678.1 gamma-glutamylcyclotransferase family protein [Anaerocolumna sp. MB42-C2]
MNKTLYLAYGSNLNLEQMAHRCPTAKTVGATVLMDYRLLFYGGKGGAVATVEPCKGKTVPCLLWEITSDDEAALDRYEGFPFLYRKETVKVKLGKKNVEAMVYLMNEGRPLGTPSCHYYSIILVGYQSSGFDIDILKQAVEDSMEDGYGQYNQGTDSKDS